MGTFKMPLHNPQLKITILLTSTLILCTLTSIKSLDQSLEQSSEDIDREFREFNKLQREAYQKHVQNQRELLDDQQNSIKKNDAELSRNEFGEDEQELEDHAKQMYTCKQNADG